MDKPLVTVICLCYNHGRFVSKAIHSVLQQTYTNIQIIVVDDNSTDDSVTVIRKALEPHTSITFLALPKNMGNCAAFNKGLALAKGEYIVDFATDDVMVPERIAKQVEPFSRLDPSYGVLFTDAHYIDESGEIFRQHFPYLKKKLLLRSVPQGDVYADLIERYFVASPTMMFRRNVIEELGGYDESLAYEDFDFWIRSSRNYKYYFVDEPLTLIRRSRGSLSSRWYKKGDVQLESTYRVCLKALQLNRTPREHAALINRTRYELRQAVFSENFREAELFYGLLKSLEAPSSAYKLLLSLAKLRLPLAGLRRLYHTIRFG
jgi:glycosyltransferase involved in cell wall biosynthesis